MTAMASHSSVVLLLVLAGAVVQLCSLAPPAAAAGRTLLAEQRAGSANDLVKRNQAANGVAVDVAAGAGLIGFADRHATDAVNGKQLLLPDVTTRH
ncbi:hypothetical protein C2845_PM03G08230 [Panicum miliaceum]|uniref:Uncharacterized protein n=1 Tax=Panicum miliaceum TaxID=4540 RepID=A0A3L6T7H7_PANMI|nr:hypothetical protein C2845_PM03G08230 [Panicum miliaceum]